MDVQTSEMLVNCGRKYKNTATDDHQGHQRREHLTPAAPVVGDL